MPTKNNRCVKFWDSQSSFRQWRHGNPSNLVTAPVELREKGNTSWIHISLCPAALVPPQNQRVVLPRAILTAGISDDAPPDNNWSNSVFGLYFVTRGIGFHFFLNLQKCRFGFSILFCFIQSRLWCKAILNQFFVFLFLTVLDQLGRETRGKPRLCLNGGGLFWMQFFQPSCELWALLASSLTKKPQSKSYRRPLFQ